MSMSVYEEVDDDGQAPIFGTNPMQEYRPPTVTGVTELPPKDFFLMILLWSPRFFGPWILALHEFNVFIGADPGHLDSEEVQRKLLTVDLAVFGGACILSIMVSVIADLASMRYYVYLTLLATYTLCPIAGVYVDVVLRARYYEEGLYEDNWLSSIVLMRIAMAIPFVFFPVQFTCIFTEKANMTRQAHYSWTAFFAFLEFLNAYAAFWVIPETCPTSEWKQTTVWGIIMGLIWLIIVLTITFTCIVKSMRYTLLICMKTCGLDPGKYLSDKYDEGLFEDEVPRRSRLNKLQWFGLILIPLVFSSFVFATLERFVPDEDWDKHDVLSATSMFYLGRLLGVVLMVVVMFWVRHGLFKVILRVAMFRADVLVLGIPHLLNIIALITLVVRFATLSAISADEIVVGPIPDNSKAVLLFVNQMFRNKTVCVRADDFRPVKVRAFRYATRELVEPETDKINFTVIPEPGPYPPVATAHEVHHIKKNAWYIFSINLFSYLNREGERESFWAPRGLEDDVYTEEKNKPRVVQHDLTGFPGYPQHAPSLLIIRNFVLDGQTPYYVFGYGQPINTNTPIADIQYTFPKTPALEYATFYDQLGNRTGRWYVAITYRMLDGKSTLPLNANTSVPCEFDAEEYSLYLVSFYTRDTIPPHIDRDDFLTELVRCKVYKIAEINGPDRYRLPTKKVLQRDKAIQAGMTFAGMSAGGLFVGIVYLFWMDPPFPGWQTTSLAVFWTLMIGAAESPKVKLVDVSLIVSQTLLGLQVILTILHVFASLNFYTPKFNFRKRAD